MHNDQMPHIALELIEAIVEQLADSPPALRACALACKAWLPVAFRILFCKFTLQAYAMSSDDLGKLHAGLIFPYYVSCLTIRSSPGQGISHTKLGDILSVFDRASKICMLYYEYKPHLDILHQTHPHLRGFEITSVPFVSDRSLQAFIAAFPHLEHLSMSYYSHSGVGREARNTSKHHPGDLAPPPRLSSLEYKSSDAHRAQFLRWLSDHQPVIQSLTLLHLSPSELEFATSLFCALGPHLHSLDISYSTRASQPRASSCLPLEANTHLHTLRISPIPVSLADLIPRLCIPPTLLDSTSPTLRCIALQLEPHKTREQNDVLEWDGFDAMLARQAPALECLHIHIASKRLYEHTLFMRRVLEAQMPWCLQQGILRGMDVEIKYGKSGFPLHERLPPPRPQLPSAYEYI